MKKLISLMLSIMIMASLAACGGAEKETSGTSGQTAQSSTASQTAAAQTDPSGSTAEAPDPVTDTDITELSSAHGRALGRYHLMTAQNPVYLFSCQGGQKNE